MRKALILFFCLIACSAFAQASGEWKLLHDSSLDTLTGVAADSTLETIDLRKSSGGGLFGGGGRVVPSVLRIVTEYADISNGEGVTQRDAIGIGVPSGISYDGNGFTTLDTLATAPTAADTWATINTITNPGSHYKYSLKAYASAADTDSLTVRRRIWGVY